MPFLLSESNADRAGLDEECALWEMHLGQADGLTWLEYDAKYGSFNITAEPSRPFAPGAESWPRL